MITSHKVELIVDTTDGTVVVSLPNAIEKTIGFKLAFIYMLCACSNYPRSKADKRRADRNINYAAQMRGGRLPFVLYRKCTKCKVKTLHDPETGECIECTKRPKK